jgi:hypothetical protein
MASDKDVKLAAELEARYEKIRKLRQDRLEMEIESAKLAGEEISRADRVIAAAEAKVHAAEKTLELIEMSEEARAREMAQIDDLIAKAKDRHKIVAASSDADKAAFDKEVEHLQEKHDLLGRINKIAADDPNSLKKMREKYVQDQKANDALKQRARLSDDLAESMYNLVGIGNKWKNTTEGQIIDLARQQHGFTLLAGSMLDKIKLDNLAGSAMTKVTTATVALFKEQDAAIASFRQATGAGAEYNSVIVDTQLELRTYGVSTAEAGAATEALFKNMASFTQMTESAQKELVGTTALLSTFGVSAETAAKSADVLVEALGMTAMEAAATQRELFATATALKLSPDVIFNEFGPAAAQLGGHGDDMIRVFKGLAAASKATSIQMSSLLKLAGQFDKFESGAQAVGKLNALLGGPYLNSIEMLNASEEERIRMIIKSMQVSGKQWSTMDKFERMAFANAAGISDMTEANKLFNTSLSAYDAQQHKAKLAAVSQEKFAEASRKAMAVLEKFRQIGENFAVSLEPLLEKLGQFADWILEQQKEWGKNFGWVVLVTALIVLFTKKLMNLGTSFLWASLKAKLAVPGLTAGGEAAASGGKKAGASALQWAAFGVAMIGVGYGVKLATEGLAKFVSAFEKLSPAQISQVNEALTVLGAVFLGLIVGLVVIAKVAGPHAAAALIGIGIGVALIGAGVWLAATGMANLADAMTRNKDALAELIPLLFAFVPIVAALGGPAAVGLTLLAFGFVALGLAIRSMPLADLKEMNSMLTAMAALGDVDVANRAKTTITQVFAEVNKLDESKVKHGTDLIDAVKKYNVTIAQQGPQAAASIEETNKLLKTLFKGPTGTGPDAAPAGGGKIHGDVYFNETLVGSWFEKWRDNKRD